MERLAGKFGIIDMKQMKKSLKGKDEVKEFFQSNKTMQLMSDMLDSFKLQQ